MGNIKSKHECEHTSYYSESDTSFLFVVLCACFFLLWSLNKVLVRKFGLGPVIRSTSNLQRAISDLPTLESNNAKELSELPLRLTKRLDKDNQYRIRQRGSVHILKAMYHVVSLSIFIAIAIDSPQWYVDFVWTFEACAVHLILAKYICILGIAWYCWEIVMIEQYFNNPTSVYVHHWLSVAVGALTLYGVYCPFFLCHLVIANASFIVDTSLTMRYAYCEFYPRTTRRVMLVAAVWYTPAMCCVVISDVLVFARLCSVGFGSETYRLSSAIISLVCAMGWLYDDQILVRTLWAWARQDYDAVNKVFVNSELELNAFRFVENTERDRLPGDEQQAIVTGVEA